MQRGRLLAEAAIELPDELDGGEAAADDVLDAAVAAWTAERRLRIGRVVHKLDLPCKRPIPPRLRSPWRQANDSE